MNPGISPGKSGKPAPLLYLCIMHASLSGWNDTIAAIATPPGVGGIGVIRVSGDRAYETVQKIFPKKDLANQPANTLHVGYLSDGDRFLDEAVVSLFKKPHSYTGEDVIEISCHGSPFVLQQVLDTLLKNGARLARAGEFTQRAFLNRKIDLVQAEAVGDLIASNTRASRNTALKNMRGGFSKVLAELRDELIKFAALIELELDFSDEDVTFADRQQFENLVNRLQQTVDQLYRSFDLGNVIRHGVSVAIVGKPNAGKSTLLNTLLNENRAIVSDIAGTTRDTIEEVININGVLFRLIDTAGIREHTQDIIEEMGVVRSREKIAEADIVLFLFDTNDTSPGEFQATMSTIHDSNPNVIPVINKSDTSTNTDAYPGVALRISARSGEGIEDLKELLFTTAGGPAIEKEDVIVTNARHAAALKEIAESLTAIKAGLYGGLSGDLLATDINRSLHYLGEITGQVTNEDKLDYIFSKFCIGK